MAHVMTDTCIKDALCAEVCSTDSIHPKKDEPGFEHATQMYVDPEGCIECGARVPACTSDSIHALEDVPAGQDGFHREERCIIQEQAPSLRILFW